MDSRRSTCICRFAWLLCVATGCVRADAVAEDELKAALTYKFAQFTDWPVAPREFSFCACGRASPENLLVSLNGKTLKNMPVVVRWLLSPPEAQNCNVLFLNHPQPNQLAQWFASIKGLPVLTVSDDPNAWDKGAMIYLSSETNRIRFDINVAAARSAGLNLRAQMVRLAREIRD